jgi:hypothetical protein
MAEERHFLFIKGPDLNGVDLQSALMGSGVVSSGVPGVFRVLEGAA